MTYEITWNCKACHAAGSTPGPAGLAHNVGVHRDWLEVEALTPILVGHLQQSPDCRGSVTITSPYYTADFTFNGKGAGEDEKHDLS